MTESENSLHLPRHLVLIPDGNGRWAQRHRLPILEGHMRGAQATRGILYELENLDIDVVTIWGFSTDNWSRSPEETTGIMMVMDNLIDQEGDRLVEKGYRFRQVGRRDRIPGEVLSKIEALEQKTLNNTGKTLILALDYGGRDEIVRAVNKTSGQEVNEGSFKEFLDTAGLPDPDLIIRTSGEMRTSGIYPYQGAYAEFVSSPVLLPDFDKTELLKCLEEYSKRQRRFGRRPELLTQKPFDWINLENTTLEGLTEALAPEFSRTADTFINQWRQGRFYRNSKDLQADITMFQQLLQGGKKIRPTLAVLGYENFAGEPEYREGILAVAIGYEIIHNSFLIHDDIMDSSPLRRGQPSVHEQYGLAPALNLGDLGPFHSLGALWDINNRENRIVRAQKWLRYVIETTLQGQRRDLSEVRLEELTAKDVYEIYLQKTAIYTIVGPLSLGAILAGASDKDLAHLNTFGVNLGIAFQMVDDHLGMFGDEQVLGKPVDSDIKEAKKTLHFVKAFQAASLSEQAFLQNVWGKKDITQEELEQSRELIIRLGVRDTVLDRADELATRAKGVIPKITNDPTITGILEGLSDFVVARNF